MMGWGSKAPGDDAILKPKSPLPEKSYGRKNGGRKGCILPPRHKNLARPPGLSSEWLLSLGTSVGPRFWPGQHVGVSAVAVRDDSLYALAGGAEGAPSVVKGSLDGTVTWESIETLEAIEG